MKRSTFIILFVIINVLLIMLQIYKHSQSIKLSYIKQRHEQEYQNLLQKKQGLLQQLYALKSPSTVKKKVTQELGMQELTFNNIKKIPT